MPDGLQFVSISCRLRHVKSKKQTKPLIDQGKKKTKHRTRELRTIREMIISEI